ncbi:MAG: YggS family pyridoxal phosphate-dependent enzyme [Bacilli bacterium]|nr:YggS family pyridoxal phosphate-dependent enzyme [Bacilli bacterium]MBN2697073.1 YggS family pyridoxal phosphate-dependent enzyme [Bacilli bacterium]
MTIAKNVEAILKMVGDRTVVAATKYVGPKEMRELYAAGITNMGENRVDQLLWKQSELTDLPITWHFIGSLQSNKVKLVADKIDFLHSLDRLSLAEAIQKYFSSPLKCFVEVHVSGEASKSGVEPEMASAFCENLAKYDKIQIVGLMGMAPLTDDKFVILGCFRKLEELRREIQAKNWSHAPCPYLSMGMSNDFKLAMECNATHLRLGSILFRNGD